jgi:hypothetical protein
MAKSHEKKLESLSEEIKRIKEQKQAMCRKMKIETTNYSKWKRARGKEILQAKQLNIKQQRLIAKLQRNAHTQNSNLQRKDVQIQMLRHGKNAINAQERSVRSQGHKQQIANASLQFGKSVQTTKQWIMNYTQAVVNQNVVNKNLALEKSSKLQVEKEVQEEMLQISRIKNHKDRFLMQVNNL